MKIQWHYLLLATIYELNVKKTQLNNSYQSMLYEDTPYSNIVGDTTAEEKRGYVQSVSNASYVFFYIYSYIFNLEHRKKLEATFLLIEKLASNFR